MFITVVVFLWVQLKVDSRLVSGAKEMYINGTKIAKCENFDDFNYMFSSLGFDDDVAIRNCFRVLVDYFSKRGHVSAS